MKKLVFLSFVSSTFIFQLLTFNLSAQETKITAAVMDLEAKEGISAGVVSSSTDYLRTQLVNTGKFDFVTRENMEQILKEQNFQISGCTSQECIIEAGKLMGVRKMFTGSIGKVGTTYIVNLRIINVESGKIEKAETEECAKCEQEVLLVSIRNIAYKIVGIGIRETVQPVSAQGGGVKETTWEKDGSQIVLISAGEFLMGSPEGKGAADERPQHKVFLDDYYIDKYEVTNQQFAKFLNAWNKDTDENGQKMIYEDDWGIKKAGAGFQPANGYDKYPIFNVTWYGANQYAKWAGKRLPTEAEWEKACRAGSTITYYYGDEKNGLKEYAWYIGNSDHKTHPVGQKKPNSWGIYDMHGNVWEWCSDRYDANYYKGSPYKNPQGPSTGSFCVLRGGSWCCGVAVPRSAFRSKCEPDFKFNILVRDFYGFRCAASAH